MTGDKEWRSLRSGAARGLEPRNKRQQAARKRVKKERKIRLGAQTLMTMVTQKQTKHNQRKTTTNLTTMVATYLVLGEGSR
jgi:hypothetical protein